MVTGIRTDIRQFKPRTRITNMPAVMRMTGWQLEYPTETGNDNTKSKSRRMVRPGSILKRGSDINTNS